MKIHFIFLTNRVRHFVGVRLNCNKLNYFLNRLYFFNPLLSVLVMTTVYFYFLITYGIYKKRKCCNRMSEEKKFFPFDECSFFVCLRRQNKQKKFTSVCLSACLSVRGLLLWTQ